jgi:SsrA-binding protein
MKLEGFPLRAGRRAAIILTVMSKSDKKPTPTSSPANKPKAAAKGAKAAAKAVDPPVHLVAENRKARFRFEILETLECGIALVGSEVKSLRDGKLSLDEAYARVKEGEVWLVGADIAEYKQASFWNHLPKRPRKLLLKKTEVRKFASQAHDKGLTLVPLRLYFTTRGLAKVELGLCRGKKIHDKRETMKKADAKRDIARAMRSERK